MSCNHHCCQKPCETVSSTITVHIADPAAFASVMREQQMREWMSSRPVERYIRARG